MFVALLLCRLDDALLQNSIADIMTADLDQLADEEAEGLAGSSTAAAAAAGGAGGSKSAAGAAGAGGGHRQERGGLTEAQTFSDLAFSKNKVSFLHPLQCSGGVEWWGGGIQRLILLQQKWSTLAKDTGRCAAG
jgi:hypothetical protein